MGHYFQKWGTIFFSPGIRFGAAISEGAQFHPVWDYIILYVKRGGVAVGPLGPPIVSGPRCQTGCCLHRRRFAQKRQKDPVGSCREGFCEMPSTPSTPPGTGNPLGFCSVEESTGGKGVSSVSRRRTRGLSAFLEPKGATRAGDDIEKGGLRTQHWQRARQLVSRSCVTHTGPGSS